MKTSVPRSIARAPTARQAALLASYPAQTTIATPHGLVTVHSAWRGDHWEHLVPSHKSNPHGVHHVTGFDCGCPARLLCWHVATTQRVEEGLHAWVWELCKRYITRSASIDDYVWGLAELAKLGLDLMTARAVVDAPALAAERAMGRAA